MKISSYGSNFKMLECQTVRHPVSPVPDWKKLTMTEQVRYWTKLTQSGIFLVRYRTKIRDAGMLMPALVSSMPMSSYVRAPLGIFDTGRNTRALEEDVNIPAGIIESNKNI